MVLEFICLDVLDDPLGELGIFKVLMNEGVTSLYDAMMISYPYDYTDFTITR